MTGPVPRDPAPRDPVLEDFEPGRTLAGGSVTVGRDGIVAFARDWDFQPFHLDEAAARDTFAGGLIASGWHTAALGMRLLQEGPFRGGSSLGSPGIRALRWLRPVRPGDSLALSVRVEGTRLSSKPGRGFAALALRLDDAAGETVMTQDFSVMLRAGGAPPPAPSAPRAAAAVPDPGPDPAGEAPPEPGDGELIPYLRDAAIGSERDLGAHRFTAEGIVAFARAYDPQAFHLDAEAARAGPYGGLIASGWHTAAAYMRRLLLTRARDTAHTAERGPVPASGPSPGFTDMRWLAPVRAGDTVRYRARLTDRRASATRPGWGLAFAHNTGVNQRGETVFSFDSAVFQQWGP